MSRIGKIIPYEPVLSGLNVLRQVTLKDSIEYAIAFPVGDKNPPNSNNPVKGTFLSGDNNGALLTEPFQLGYDNYELYQELGWSSPSIKTVTFAQAVKGVLAYVEKVSGDGFVFWAKPLNWKIILQFTDNTHTWMPFRGTSFMLYKVDLPAITYNLYFWGFY